MTKTSWVKTPFETLEQAHQYSEGLGLCPSEITIKQGYRFFQISENRKLITLAQKVGGGPVKENTEKTTKRFRDKSKGPVALVREWMVSKWIRVEHSSLEAAEASYLEHFNNPENVEVIRVIMFRDKDRETEYAEDRGGVWTRVLTRSPLRDASYRKAVQAREDKAREDGTLR